MVLAAVGSPLTKVIDVHAAALLEISECAVEGSEDAAIAVDGKIYITWSLFNDVKIEMNENSSGNFEKINLMLWERNSKAGLM